MIAPSLILTSARVRDYWELTKPRLVSLVLLSTAVGFFMASEATFRIWQFAVMLVATALMGSASMVLNQWMEREEDARMTRTCARPLPSGRLQPAEALGFGLLLAVAGLSIFFACVNFISGLLAIVTLATYLLIYTPLKKKTSLCTPVGAVPGALPPLIGWAAAAGKPSLEAWILFGILFLWQMPHFYSIAWICKEDYTLAGFRMLSVEDHDGNRVWRQILLYSLALLPVSLLPSVARLTGCVYFFSALFLGLSFSFLAFKSPRQMDQKARSLFRASIIYLAALLLLMLVDRI